MIAAKQEAFEESIRLKNQFRTLDDDEVEFLDSVLESTRAKEEAVKRETVEQLDVFRRQQEEADRALLLQQQEGLDEDKVGKTGNPTTEETQWAVNGRKRKRVKEKDVLKGVKLRKSSIASKSPTAADGTLPSTLTTMNATTKEDDTTNQAPPSFGLADGKRYSNSAFLTRSRSQEGLSETAVPLSKGPGLPGLGLAGYCSDDED